MPVARAIYVASDDFALVVDSPTVSICRPREIKRSEEIGQLKDKSVIRETYVLPCPDYRPTVVDVIKSGRASVRVIDRECQRSIDAAIEAMRDELGRLGVITDNLAAVVHPGRYREKGIVDAEASNISTHVYEPNQRLAGCHLIRPNKVARVVLPSDLSELRVGVIVGGERMLIVEETVAVGIVTTRYAGRIHTCEDSFR